MTKRAEKCTCTCGGAESEDHTVDNGCEQRGCTCTWWPITFENINNKIEITKWYSISGAPHMEHKDYATFAPMSVRFVFVDGECNGVFINARIVRKDGSVGDRYQQVPYVFSWNQDGWPIWLSDVHQLACADMERDLKTSALVH